MLSDGWQLEAMTERGQPHPDWATWTPLLPLEIEEFYVRAFFDLSTCRPIGFGVGAIPWTAILAWAQTSELDRDVTRLFVHVIRRMDAAYLKIEHARIEAENSK